MRLPLLIVLVIILSACAEKQQQVAENPQNDMIPYTDPNESLRDLGIILPEVSPPVANYVNTVRTGSLLYTAGKIPVDSAGNYVTGKLGAELSVEQGYEAARLAGIQLLAVLEHELGDLNRVSRIVKLRGMVNASPDFTAHSKVINGCSDLMVQVFGDRGRHARVAVGMGSLPVNAAVEIDLVVEVKP